MSDWDQQEFENWIGSLAHEDHLIVVQRACIDLGWGHELMPEGGVGVDGELDSEEFRDAMHERYLQKYIGEAFEDLVEDGKIRPVRVDANGEILYAAVED